MRHRGRLPMAGASLWLSAKIIRNGTSRQDQQRCKDGGQRGVSGKQGRGRGRTLTAAVRWRSVGSAQEPAAAVVAEVAATGAASAVAAAAGPGLRAAIAGTGKGCRHFTLSFSPPSRIQEKGDATRQLEELVHPQTDVLGDSVSYPFSVLDQVVSMMQSDDTQARRGEVGRLERWLRRTLGTGRLCSHSLETGTAGRFHIFVLWCGWGEMTL